MVACPVEHVNDGLPMQWCRHLWIRALIHPAGSSSSGLSSRGECRSRACFVTKMSKLGLSSSDGLARCDQAIPSTMILVLGLILRRRRHPSWRRHIEFPQWIYRLGWPRRSHFEHRIASLLLNFLGFFLALLQVSTLAKQHEDSSTSWQDLECPNRETRSGHGNPRAPPLHAESCGSRVASPQLRVPPSPSCSPRLPCRVLQVSPCPLFALQ